ncbi:MAG: LytR/AlgR family response regulator transcription factor [Leadbetterella sp.]
MKTKEIHVGSRQKLLPQEIVYLKSDLNYTQIFLRDGKQILSSTTLKKIEGRFANCGFLRVHRSTVVNTSYVESYEDKELSGEITLSNQNKIIVSRRQNEKLRHINFKTMKKIIFTFAFILSITKINAQNAVTISPGGSEPLKFNNNISDKITLYDNGATSKYGIGILSGKYQFYVPIGTDDFLFGVGSNSSFAEKFRIKGNGVIQTKNRIQLFDAGSGESAGLWFYNNGNSALNTFLGIDLSNRLGIYSPLLTKNIFTADMANGGIRLEGPSVSSPTVNILSMGGFGRVSVDAPGIIGGRMTILENGNVGLGTSTPAGQLTLSKTNGGAAYFQSPATGNTTIDGFFVGMGSSGDAYLFNYENTNLIFSTNGTDRMQLTAAGNLDFVGGGKIVNEAFQSVFFQNSWGNQNAGYSTAQYYKDKEGRVHIKGVVVNGTATISGSTIFTLPVGYRPFGNEQLVYNTFDGVTNRRVDIMPNGEVKSVNGGAALIFLDGISFRAD